MKSENKQSGNALRLGVGIMIGILGLNLGLYFLAVVGIVMAVSGIRGLKNNNDKAEDRNIVSGVNRTMPDNNTYVRSAESYGYKHKSSNEGFKDKADSPNECPVCKEISANGYCIKCGYRFR